MSFEIQKEERNGKTQLKFCGLIDEEVQFPRPDEWGSEVYIDLGEVKAINSVGIRAWILFFAELTQTHFTFLNCPKSLVMQMNMVEGFLPQNSKVETMHVPFFCEDCDEEIEMIFEVGKEITVLDGEVKVDFDKTNICQSGCDPELDVSEAKFFRFLLNQQERKVA